MLRILLHALFTRMIWCFLFYTKPSDHSKKCAVLYISACTWMRGNRLPTVIRICHLQKEWCITFIFEHNLFTNIKKRLVLLFRSLLVVTVISQLDGLAELGHQWYRKYVFIIVLRQCNTETRHRFVKTYCGYHDKDSDRKNS